MKLYSLRHHYVLSFSQQYFHTSIDEQLYIERAISYNDLIDGVYSKKLQRKIWRKNVKYSRTYILKNEDTTIGYVSIMMNGGKELLYEVKYSQAYIYNVYIKPEFRGKGYAKDMLLMVIKELHEEKIDEIIIAVLIDNIRALNTYIKVGGIIVKRVMFLRVCRCNIPQRTI